ncbi:hypothetical protein HDU93_000523, partial [Gonapodya sp. JEL0774]
MNSEYAYVLNNPSILATSTLDQKQRIAKQIVEANESGNQITAGFDRYDSFFEEFKTPYSTIQEIFPQYEGFIPMKGGGQSLYLWKASDKRTGKSVVIKNATDSVINPFPNIREARWSTIFNGLDGCASIVKVVRTLDSLFIVISYAGEFNAITFAQHLGRQARKSPQRMAEQLMKLERLMYDAIVILHRIHDLGAIVCDVKPQSMVLDERGNLTIIDFGMMMQMRHDGTVHYHGGSPSYAAPECNTKDPIVTQKADVYFLGMTFSQIFYSFYHPDRGISRAAIVTRDGNLFCRTKLPSSMQALLLELLQVDPRQRPNMSDIFTSGWAQEACLKYGWPVPVFSQHSILETADTYIENEVQNFMTRTLCYTENSLSISPYSSGELQLTMIEG